MTAIISLLIIISLSILATRIATLALIHTGMSKETAKFQARSAFMGVGFTTKESEMVVNHPVRRKILTLLIFLGNAGIITTVSSAIFSFISLEGSGFLSLEVLVLFSGLILLIFLTQSKWIDKKLSVLINKALSKYTQLDVRDYYNLLNLEGDYRVTEIKALESHWITGKCLQDLELDKEGLLVLGIKRANGEFTGAPTGTTEVKEGDIAIIYGHGSLLNSLEKRQQGNEGNQQHKDTSKAKSEEER
ncbi:TrkA C-terminal domain-containing protein [Autumnicola psychrophila]|uniref:TrkA C-terminal domain-containing protein n=1 Tax=Autumnicola psychrophila TaxID=3075592 RepID=A0ABU3DTY9_9FLAO|nr:TrkA C-terminal domain-containing protein [Zunongwangia sp. F225]MDT0687184.1 TrkA C-terminal domain-containing protein [Zunongwangia sp. F225]